ncbi:uncharacterized protein EDB91DRAFT_1197293 [Suillus paluster]|uniref:uncharacterized protein n=1 Tax=Suillus paluster TaxID=48578 RepID=UPI001B872140|nr:uncharacterized protein EDB91DRAFT_1197293 [Suillus paluster]KAG1749916.1 hypothetical protein EDB91DRAFT_1197293 [Suillus paluster]
MLYHASRLLKPSSVLPDATSSFSAILQSAAARAWTRRAEYHGSVLPEKKYARISRKSRSDKPLAPQPPTNSPTRQSQGVIPIDPNTLSIIDATWKDPGRAEPVYIPNPPSQSGTFVSASSLTATPIPCLPTPTSREMFYQNLLDMHNYSHSSLTTLVNYHFSNTRLLRSTRSFNFLVSLALRQAAFGTAARLLDAMKAESVRPNLETWKLTVRWLVRTGRWDEALRRVQRVMRREQWSEDLGLHSGNQSGLPLPLWMEFFGSLKRGALRRWVKIPQQRGEPGRKFASFRCVVLQTSTLSGSAQVARYRSLTNMFPLVASREYSQLPPRAVFFIVQAMIQLGNRGKALDITSSYFQSLPRRLSRRQQHAALDIIHLHIRAVTEIPGLARHFAQRRVISKLLSAHPGIRPSSKTLFLTLASLRPCKRCGTLAMKCLKAFRTRWGPRTESSVVRRRIASLSIKEGRLDIAAVMLESERTLRAQKQSWRTQRDITGGSSPRAFTRLLRRSTGKVLHGRGAENWKWQALERKLSTLKQRRVDDCAVTYQVA